jgi:thiol-disulfide isomerase/thioredoxin
MRWLLLFLVAFLLFRWVRDAAAPDPTVLPPLPVQYVPGAQPYVPGRPSLWEFWATWCPPCRETVPHLNRLLGECASLELQIIGVTDEDVATIEAFRRKHPIHYAVAMDGPGLLSRHFDVEEIPHAVLVDASGKVCWRGDPRELTFSRILEALP